MAAYIHTRSKSGAAAWNSAFHKARRRLEESPEAFAECQEGDVFDCPVREVLFGTRKGLTYRIVFTVEDGEVQILRIRGPGQAPVDPSDLTEQ
jgi:hypothetical protein